MISFIFVLLCLHLSEELSDDLDLEVRMAKLESLVAHQTRQLSDLTASNIELESQVVVHQRLLKSLEHDCQR